MLDRKQPDQQQCRRNGQWERQPGMTPRAAKQSRHDEKKRQPRIEKLSNGTPPVGAGVGRYDLPPRARLK